MLYEKILKIIAGMPHIVTANEKIENLLRPEFLGSVAQEIHIAVVPHQPLGGKVWVSGCNEIFEEIVVQIPGCQSTYSLIDPASDPDQNELCFAHIKSYEVIGTIQRSASFKLNTNVAMSPSVLPNGWNTEHICQDEQAQLRRLVTLWIYPSHEMEQYIRFLGPYTLTPKITMCRLHAFFHPRATTDAVA